MPKAKNEEIKNEIINPENNKKEGKGRALLSWKIPEFVRHERGIGWYILAFLIGAGLLLYAIFTANFLFAVIVLMAVLILALGSRQQPKILPFEILETGIVVGQRYFPYKNFSHFWIIYEPPEVKNLYFDFISVLKPTLSVPLENQNPNEVRKILLQYLKEDTEKEHESFSDFISRKLKI